MNVFFPAHEKLTSRPDRWWLYPLLTFISGAIALGYASVAAVLGSNYEFGPYVSPIYSTPYVPEWFVFSPAFILLWIPVGFRLTCYYGRKVYFQALLADPLNCAVEEPYRKKYTGESKFPFILNNLHRYFLYAAIVLVFLHWYEFIHSLFFGGRLYLGLGTFIIAFDTLALTAYVGSCHSLRHLLGGKNRGFSTCAGKAKISYHLWKKASYLNIFHNFWFWLSLYSVAIADLYVRLLAMGIIPYDLHVIV